MNLPFKVCPECGVEHVHTATVCADCRVALVIAPAEAGEPPAIAALPPASELLRVAVGGPWEMERLALELQQAGISSRVDPLPAGRATSRPAANTGPRGSAARLALYVLPREAEAARGVIQGLLLHDEPGAGAPAREGDPLDACPACGAPISAAASACEDCGLPFLPAEEPCAVCGAAAPAEATSCPTCGAARPRDPA